jgi:ribulose-phosphate 3-epimerase
LIIQISPSILSTDFTDNSIVEKSIMRVSNADFIHFDVMDGKFVESTTFDHNVVKDAKMHGLLKDVHLMVEKPEEVVDDYINAGANIITFHVEACKDPGKLIDKIKESNIMAGISLKPDTPLKDIEKYLDKIDLVLVMTVEPGKGGQKMIKETLDKIKTIRKKYPTLNIEADGGINDKTAGEVIDAGANILVSGSYIFSSTEPKIAVDILRNA